MKVHGLIIRLFVLCIVASLSLFFTGCGKKAVIPDELESNILVSRSDEIDVYNQKLFSDANISQDRSDYLLGSGDLLEIKVYQAENLNTIVRISSRGIISLPLLGEIDLTGKTAFEAEALIEEKYREKYIRDPHVSIFVKEHYSQRVTVVGEVKNPGTYDYPSQHHLLDVLALAGGLTEKAGQIVHVRKLQNVSSGETEQTYMIDLEELIGDGKTELNITVNGGDVIFVPEAGFFYVDGAVRRPGQYHIKNKLNLNEAIINAGGLLSYAKKKEIVLLRKTDAGQRKEITVNLKKNAEAVDELIVEDGDIIFVDAGFWAKFFSGSGVNIGLPGMGFSYRDPERRY